MILILSPAETFELGARALRIRNSFSFASVPCIRALSEVTVSPDRTLITWMRKGFNAEISRDDKVLNVDVVTFATALSSVEFLGAAVKNLKTRSLTVMTTTSN